MDSNPQVYWRVFKKRLNEEGSSQPVTKCNGLKMIAPDGKNALDIGILGKAMCKKCIVL